MTQRRPSPRAGLAGALALAALLAGCAGNPGAPVGPCPQPRFTGRAPDTYYQRTNPLAGQPLDVPAASRLYRVGKEGASCADCHGATGNGQGVLAARLEPPPRNFACAKTVDGIPDGQLFWIIRFGSPGTAMPAHPGLTDTEIWTLVSYLRRLTVDDRAG